MKYNETLQRWEQPRGAVKDSCEQRGDSLKDGNLGDQNPDDTVKKSHPRPASSTARRPCEGAGQACLYRPNDAVPRLHRRHVALALCTAPWQAHRNETLRRMALHCPPACRDRRARLPAAPLSSARLPSARLPPVRWSGGPGLDIGSAMYNGASGGDATLL